jgi:non-ribosomal peptide synthetase component E (peptide arylation enzyme)
VIPQVGPRLTASVDKLAALPKTTVNKTDKKLLKEQVRNETAAGA